jgi:hypothetical protein
MSIRITRKAAERKKCRGATWFDQRPNEYNVQAITREVDGMASPEKLT